MYVHVYKKVHLCTSERERDSVRGRGIESTRATVRRRVRELARE